MRFAWRHLQIVAAVMAGSLVLAACGGGDEELDLEQYFRRLEDVRNQADTRMDALEKESEGVTEDIEAVRDYYEGVEAILRQDFNDMKDIRAPAEAQDAHDELVAGLEERLALWEDFTEQAADFSLLHALKAMKRELDKSLEAVQKRIDDACLQLEGVGDENGVEVDLKCE